MGLMRFPGETNAGNLAFELRRHTGAGTFQGVATNFAFGFTPGQVVSLQVSTNWCQVYYGTNLLINQIHGLTNAETVYSQGVYPHLELQNGFSATNLTGYLGDVLCRQRSTFGPP